eukprot:g3149.t1
MLSETAAHYAHIRLKTHDEHVLEVRMSRERKRNAMNKRFYLEIGHVFSEVIPFRDDIRVVVLTGAGPVFSAGIDINSVVESGGIGGVAGNTNDDPVVRKAAHILRDGGLWQRAWLALRKCPKPVLAAIQGGCFGAALELVSFCDVRWCAEGTIFQAPEVDLGFAADIGGCQQFPKTVPDSFAREVLLSGRKFDASEALRVGFVSRVMPQKRLLPSVFELAQKIASKSPIATASVKEFVNFSSEHNLEDSLKFSLRHNAAMLQTSHTKIAGMAFATKTPANFPNAPSTSVPPFKLNSKL